MGQQPAVLLLLLYILLPVKVGYVGALVAQKLLCQIKGIYVAQQVEKRLASSVSLDEGLALLVFWLKWHQVIQSNLSISAVKFDLWFTSLIYHLRYGIYRKTEVLKELLLARWFDPDNAIAQAYLGLFTPCPVFLSHQNGDRIIGNGFTLVGQADPNVTITCQVAANQERFLETRINTDRNGNFEVSISLSSAKPSGTRYTVFVIVSNPLEMATGTRLTLIQA